MGKLREIENKLESYCLKSCKISQQGDEKVLGVCSGG